MSANTRRQPKSVSENSFFSDRLKSAMKAGGFSKLSLSKKLGVAHTTVAAWLKGSEPGSEKIAPLAKELGVDAQWLLSGNTQELPTAQSWFVNEAPERIETMLSAGPEGAAKAMTEEQLEQAIMEWATMLPKQQSYMKRAILGNLAVFIHELHRRLSSYV